MVQHRLQSGDGARHVAPAPADFGGEPAGGGIIPHPCLPRHQHGGGVIQLALLHGQGGLHQFGILRGGIHPLQIGLPAIADAPGGAILRGEQEPAARHRRQLPGQLFKRGDGNFRLAGSDGGLRQFPAHGRHSGCECRQRRKPRNGRIELAQLAQRLACQQLRGQQIGRAGQQIFGHSQGGSRIGRQLRCRCSQHRLRWL